VLADVSTKIEAVAQLHRLLVEQGQAQVELSEYLREVVKTATLALNVLGGRLVFEARAQISAHSRRAAAMGLFLSEANTNSLKHAKGAYIRVVLRMSGNDFLLEVADNGPGLLPGFDEASSSGFRLMRSLASRLNGRVEFDKSPGAGLCGRLVVPPK
jgi:two-component sensor histidine kinase